MKNKYLLVLGLTLALGLTGCMTEATQARFTAEGANSQACKIKMIDARVQIEKYKADAANAIPQASPVTYHFKTENAALTAMMVQQMGTMHKQSTGVTLAMVDAFTNKDDGIGSCDDTIVAMVRADAAKVAGLNNAGMTAFKWTAGLIGLGIISDNWGPGAYNGSTAKTQNNYNSRVVSDSTATGGSSVSASGTGMGIGNTGGGADTVGGLYPRSQMDTVATDGGQNSNSGELNANFPLEEAPVPEPK